MDTTHLQPSLYIALSVVTGKELDNILLHGLFQPGQAIIDTNHRLHFRYGQLVVIKPLHDAIELFCNGIRMGLKQFGVIFAKIDQGFMADYFLLR